MGTLRLLIIAVVAVPTYHGYYLTSDATGKRWLYYVMCGVLILALADTVRVMVPNLAARWLTFWVGLCWWIEVEAAQQAVCGLARWGKFGPNDICVDWFGGLDAYRVIASLAIAGALAWRPSRQP